MNVTVMHNHDTSPMDADLLDENRKFMRVFPASVLKAIPHELIRVWAHKNARYGLPTTELVAWLKEKIGSRTALEIGAGMGDLGHALGIPMTDSAMQVTRLDVARQYALMGQPVIDPPPEVERLDAHAAIEKHKPQVVIGPWITQKWREGEATGNMYGPDEAQIIRECDLYIHIGNEATHGDKRILKLGHSTYRFPWLVSRAADQSKNVIYIWGE